MSRVEVQVERATGRILASGQFPAGSPDPATIDIVEITALQAAKFEQPGEKRLGKNGQVDMTPPGPDPLLVPRATPYERLAAKLDEVADSGDPAAIARAVAATLRELGRGSRR